jgi:RNA polymerase sigma-70 factor (ECF subfamily)
MPEPGQAEEQRAAGPSTPADPAEVAVNRTVLREALYALSGRERELVALKFFAGLSNSEIGAVIGTSETNAGTRLHRVIEKLRRALDEAD